MSHFETVTTELYVTSCPTCHVVHAIPRDMERRMREKGGKAFCANGHEWWFTETANQRLEKELARERAQHDQTRAARDAAREARDQAARRAAAARGQVTKIKNRVGNGVCPCCNRTFQNLHRHMATKHPAWKRDDGGGA